MMSSKMRLKIRTKYKMKNVNKIVVNNFKEKVKIIKEKEKPKIDYIERYKAYLGYILN